MATTAQAMSTFLVEIQPTKYHKETLIPARKRTVVENLETAFPATSDMPFWKAELIGSAAKDTVIRPIDDVDTLAVFSNAKRSFERYRNDSKAFLYRIRRAYDGLSVQQVGARGQAVRVFFQSGGHVDVAPVFHVSGDDYYLPAGDGSWILTSPLKANAWFLARDRDLSYNLGPLVQLLKKWNREHSSRMKSFHMETVAGGIFSKLGANHRSNLARFFEWAPDRLSVSDPGGHSADLSTYLSWQAREDLKQVMRSSEQRAKKALDAEAAGNHVEAKRLWRIILGSDFPA